MKDDTLVCTACDAVVTAAVGHDGYRGRCRCQSYLFTVGSGDRPRAWEVWDDVSSPEHFKLYREGHIRNGDTVDQDHVVCLRCNDGANIELEVEEVALSDADIKVTFRCTAGHYRDDREIESVAYYPSERGDRPEIQERMKALKEELSDE